MGMASGDCDHMVCFIELPSQPNAGAPVQTFPLRDCIAFAQKLYSRLTQGFRCSQTQLV
jgi:hypothetical protein